MLIFMVCGLQIRTDGKSRNYSFSNRSIKSRASLPLTNVSLSSFRITILGNPTGKGNPFASTRDSSKTSPSFVDAIFSTSLAPTPSDKQNLRLYLLYPYS